MKLTDPLRREYVRMFIYCEERQERSAALAEMCAKVLAGRSRYEALSRDSKVPWYVIGLLHAMESGCNFSRHLHNGDSLKVRTVNAPKGRPPTGSPPFTFEESARDALAYDGLSKVKSWDVAEILFRFEGFNGFGYRRLSPPCASPYLWSFSRHYERGKFVRDGVFDEKAVSEQVGAAVLLWELWHSGQCSLAFDVRDLAVSYLPSEYRREAFVLQCELNQRRTQKLKEDGFAGKKTSEAFYEETGEWLPGDERARMKTRRR